MWVLPAAAAANPRRRQLPVRRCPCLCQPLLLLSPHSGPAGVAVLAVPHSDFAPSPALAGLCAASNPAPAVTWHSPVAVGAPPPYPPCAHVCRQLALPTTCKTATWWPLLLPPLVGARAHMRAPLHCWLAGFGSCCV
jgi:hypothetical protein